MKNEPHMTAGASHKSEPDENLICKRAHAIWIEEGKPEGRALGHWLRALTTINASESSGVAKVNNLSRSAIRLTGGLR